MSNPTVNTASSQSKAPIGGGFIVADTPASQVFIPEEFTEEQKMIGESVVEFMTREVHPVIHEMETDKGPSMQPGLLEKAGEMGFLALHIAPEYGGLGVDFNTGLLFGEKVAYGFSFATTIGAQTSIGSLPISFYGTKEQKEKYLPKLASGEWKCSYCLTEPDAGSDANSGKTRARLSPDGKHYILNGQKMWITNGGFANIFIVFAKVEDDKNLTAFIVQKAFGGITIGEEEKKLGIKGSSTVQVFFNDCPVPIENMLGEREGGFKMALNILNTGRIKLASGSVCGMKIATNQALKYAIERRQFDKSIAEFGAIQHKLANMVSMAFCNEAAVYRTGANIDRKHGELVAEGKDENQSILQAVREYAIECAIMKVHASEDVTYCVDEALQIYGGMGYSKEAGVEMGYRDARILRIYEGTSEINRMLSVGELFKRALKDKAFDLAAGAKSVPGAVMGQFLGGGGSGPYPLEKKMVDNLKRAFLIISGKAGQKFKLALADQQEIIISLADMLAKAYVAESGLLRLEKIRSKADKDPEMFAIQEDMFRVFLYEAIEKVKKSGRDAILSFAEGNDAKMLHWFLKRLTKGYNFNAKDARRRIAAYLIRKGEYPFV
ncbi:MAG: acyl-CoA dehydrogenase family protein [Bacteroidia bacterium]|nr:acyl-CoA dehydrogenase family protein [Bacteroidia bacterium]